MNEIPNFHNSYFTIHNSFAAPHQGHLDTVIEEIEFQIDANPDIERSIAVTKYGKPKIIRKPYFRIEFTNGSVLYFRPAGAYGDAFRSLHVGRVWVDEGAWLSERAWKALRQCLKTGGRLRIYSTPNGLRGTTYYRLTLSKQFHVFRWPSWLNPLWSKQREDELLEFYGGRDSAGWQHEVAGEHGKPSYGAFGVEHLNRCTAEVAEYRRIVITGSELSDCVSEEEAADRLEMLMALVPESGRFWIGGDLGYTNDPTELVVFREEEGDKPLLRLILRLHLEHVSYPRIAQTLALLERYYAPLGIGVDTKTCLWPDLCVAAGTWNPHVHKVHCGSRTPPLLDLEPNPAFWKRAVVQELLTLDKFRELGLEGS